MSNKIQISEPSPLFKPFIRHYKYVETDMTGTFKIVPIPYVELYFNFTHVNLYSPGCYDVNNPRIHLAGLHNCDQNAWSKMHGTDRNGGFAIVFQPQGFYDLFRIRSSDFSRICLTGDAIFSIYIYRLWEQLLAYNNVNDMKNVAERFFSDYAIKAHCDIHIIDHIIGCMDKNDGMIRVSEICNIYNITPRSLERHFNEEIGISAKELLHIFRINNAIRLISRKPDCDLTDISYLSGYYDQSHFIKDIKRITGVLPGDLLSKNTSKEEIHNRIFIKTD